MSELFPWSPPAWVPTEAWDAFVAMRKKKGSRAPWTDVARDRCIAKLDDMRKRGVDISEVLLTCVEMGWSGVEWGEAELARKPVLAHSRRDEQPSRQMRALESLSRGRR